MDGDRLNLRALHIRKTEPKWCKELRTDLPKTGFKIAGIMGRDKLEKTSPGGSERTDREEKFLHVRTEYRSYWQQTKREI